MGILALVPIDLKLGELSVCYPLSLVSLKLQMDRQACGTRAFSGVALSGLGIVTDGMRGTGDRVYRVDALWHTEKRVYLEGIPLAYRFFIKHERTLRKPSL